MPGPRREQRAIGIQIIGGVADHAGKLVGVLTDMQAHKVDAPIEEPISNTAEDRVIDSISHLVARLSRDMDFDDELVGIGIEVPGLLHEGFVTNAPSLGWESVPLLRRLTRRSIGAPITLVNDANALAVYERDFPDRPGVIDPAHFVVVLMTELGIGMGLVLNGTVYEGYRGMAGELGHIAIDGDGDWAQECECGKKGCLQSLATADAINKALQANGSEDGDEAARPHPDAPLVAKVFTHAGAALGQGLSTVVNLFNPSTIVIYGQQRIVGQARRFRLDSHRPPEGTAGHYMNAMVDKMGRNVFDRAADDCLIIVRTEKDYRGAEAAAACAIDQVRLQDRGYRHRPTQ